MVIEKAAPAPRSCRKSTTPHSFAQAKIQAAHQPVSVIRTMLTRFGSDPEGHAAVAEFELCCGGLSGRGYLRPDGSVVLPPLMLPAMTKNAVTALLAEALHLHGLGPRAVVELLLELAPADRVLDRLNAYRRVTPDLLQVLGGDRFAPRLSAVPDGRRMA